METLLYNISQVLGITLLHSLWQGLLIYAVIRLLLIGFPAISATRKYNLLYTALMAMTIWFAYTFFMEAKLYNWTANQATHFSLPTDATVYSNSEIKPTIQPDQPFYYNYKQLIKTYLPYISVLYLLSVVINLVRLAMGWQSIRKIRKHAIAAAAWQPLTDKLAERAGILKYVQISFSNLIDVPCAFGYIKPILLLPVSISTQLSAEEIEVIILHELAHIKNNDYILNLIQQIIALLLFLNPFAQLVSKMIDLERENRCDDTVLQIGDPLTYAGALVKLEKTRQSNLLLAMSATGKKYHLFARIQRIMGGDKPVVNIKHLVFGMLIFIGGLGSIAWLNPEIKDGKLSSKNGGAAVQQLAEMVKEVLTPDETNANGQINTPLVTGNPAEVPLADSITNWVMVDSVEIKIAERNALIEEWENVFNDWVDGNKRIEKMPESKAVQLARKMLDSARRLKVNAALTPDLEQERRDKQSNYDKYYKSPEVLAKLAEVKKLSLMRLNLERSQPEWKAFEVEHKRLWDSVQNAIMRTNNINEEQLQKNEEWEKWLRKESSRRDILSRKLSFLPEVIALQDSLLKVSRSIMTGPAYEEYKKNSTWSKAYIDIQTPKGVENYESELKQAKEKLSRTAVYIKNQRDQKRLHEISEILDQLKQK